MPEEFLDALIEQYRAGEVELTGFIGSLIKAVLERGLQAELAHHLGYDKHDRAGHGSGNSRVYCATVPQSESGANVCGLVATTNLDTFGGKEALQSSLQALASRGPDSTGALVREPFGFGHRRLTIIGGSESGGQPAARDPEHILVYNGEIYNYQELALALGVHARCDTDVLYEIARRGWWAWLDRLRGMFAFVHVDLEHQVLTAARDPFGIKPLYALRHTNGEWSFASTVSALAVTGDSLSPNPVAIVGFLAEGLFSAGESPFAEVEKLAPGEVRQLQQGSDEWIQKRWDISPAGWEHEDTEDALRDAIRAHLVSDVEVGVLLSGGVDSTLLAVLASKEVDHLRTFSLVNPLHQDIDESSFARHNARLMGAEHIEVPVEPQSLASRVEPLVRSCGEPFSDAAYLPLAALSEVVSQNVKAALAGEGADELFAGYRRYDVERWLDRPAARTALYMIGRKRADVQPVAKANHVSRAVQAAAFSNASDRHGDLLFARWRQVERAFGPPGVAAHRCFYSRWTQAGSDPWAMGMPPNRAYDLREWLPNVFLEKSDRASMLYSLELRTPYLDPVVANSIRGLNPKNTVKVPLRRLLHEELPGVHLPKKKMGLSVDVGGVMVTPLMSDTVSDMIHDGGSILRGIGLTDPNGLEDLAHADPQFAFRLATLGLWQTHFLR